jgi:hypothetical protein
MKKLIYVSFLVLSAGALSSFTMKNDTAAAKHDTVADRTSLGTADDRTSLGTADDRTSLGTADARRAKNHASDRTSLGTAD